MVKASSLLHALIKASEKSAGLARAVRAEESLFALLVEEKTGASKNERFVQDFKTLADVLVQETVKHDVCKQFPELRGGVLGEENNTFTNAKGESITVEVKDEEEDTAQLLVQVLDGNEGAAKLLAAVVHRASGEGSPPPMGGRDVEINVADFGIWIDPIDGTQQYVKGEEKEVTLGGIYRRGVETVSVLIGVFSRSSGLPVMGVTNLPFASRHQGKWQGRCMWGVALDGLCVTSLVPATQQQQEQEEEGGGERGIIVTSSSEAQEVLGALATDFRLATASSAGYKLVTVIDRQACAYVLSRPTCYRYDTCAPHALLRALGGGVLDLRQARLALEGGASVQRVLSGCQVLYHAASINKGADREWSNDGGILAYIHPDTAHKVLSCLK